MCCWILEIGLVIMGLFAAIKGEIMLTRKRVVRGGAARLVGALLAAPVPLGVGAVFLGVAIDMGAGGQGSGTWAVAGGVVHVALHAIGLTSALVVAVVKHDRPGTVTVMRVYEGMAPALQFPTTDPENPYASPFGQNPPPPPRG